jgi:hypothetical protein
MTRIFLLAFLSIVVFEGVVFAESGPVFSDTGTDAEAYGASKGYPVPPFEYPPGSRQEFLVGTYSHFASCIRCAPFKNRRCRRF